MGAPLPPEDRARIHAMNDVGFPKAAIAREIPCAWATVQSHLLQGDREPLEALIVEAKGGLRDGLYLTAFRANERILDAIDGVSIETAGDLRNMATVVGITADKLFKTDPNQNDAPPEFANSHGGWVRPRPDQPQ